MKTIAKLVGPLLLAAAVGLAGVQPAQAARCKDYTRCEQAVKNWCEGRHPRADGDNDGIPCENVCKSRKQVNSIRKRIGC